MYIVGNEEDLLSNSKVISRVDNHNVITDSKLIADELGVNYEPDLMTMTLRGFNLDTLLVVTNPTNRYNKSIWNYLMQGGSLCNTISC